MIDQKLGRPLLYIACRHHIMEIVFKCMISKSLGPSSGPEFTLFQRFEAEWEFINQEEYTALNLEQELETKNDIILFCLSQFQECQIRDCYKECLQLAIITLGAMPKLQSDNQSFHFIAPGVTH